MNIKEALIKQFGDNVYLDTLEQNIYQLFIPIYHEDGDMISIYLDIDPENNHITIRDYGNTVMRLSYTFDLNTDHKMSVLKDIVNSNRAKFDDGELLLETTENGIAESVFKYCQLVSKVSTMNILKQSNINTLFYDYLSDFIVNKLDNFVPEQNIRPIEERPDIVVDWAFNRGRQPIYLYGVRDDNKAKEATICCLELYKNKRQYSTIIVYEDFNKIATKERTRLLNASDKQYTSLTAFEEDAEEKLSRLCG